MKLHYSNLDLTYISNAFHLNRIEELRAIYYRYCELTIIRASHLLKEELS